MKVKQLISELQQLNPDVEVRIMVHDKVEVFSVGCAWKGNKTTQKQCDSVVLFVDRLNQMFSED